MRETETKDSISLSEVHRTVATPKTATWLKRMFAFAGPAYLVSVGYMDPGNWATDLEGGARFGYSLIWVLLMSNMMAVLLQTLSARMGIATGRDLAQACRDNYPKPVAMVLWALCEIAIAACDLAEVLGTAIGLNLLLKVPLLYGVIITGFDTMLFLAIQQLGIRKTEGFILMLMTTIGICFGIEVFLSKPEWSLVATGFVPQLNNESLYIAIGILGATVMPHNLYLHSALVQTRDYDQTDDGKATACKFNLFDTIAALNAAFLVNAAILIVAAAVFFRNSVVVTEIQQAHQMLTPLLGTAIAAPLFAIALISSGQSSTLTGTLAGQMVMEGFLHFKIRPVIRRIATRSLAIIPAILVIVLRGERATFPLLILSQVVLSLQLPFAVVPLIQFTSDTRKMGRFVNPRWVKILAWIAAAVIIVLNALLLFNTIMSWIEGAGSYAIWIWLTVIPLTAGCGLLLLYMMFPRTQRRRRPAPVQAPEIDLTPKRYTRIGVALDYSPIDTKVLGHARTLAELHGAEMVLFHVVEGMSGQLYGKNAYDSEARDDRQLLEQLARQLQTSGVNVRIALGYGRVPNQLIQLVNEMKIDILVMGGHRHRGLDDVIFGTSISKVRHALSIPVLVVQ